jgi:hypothetical protein
MRISTTYLQLILRVVLTVAILPLLSCTQSPFSPQQPDPVFNQPFYRFKKEEITQFKITRSFPGEERWNLDLKNENGLWKIEHAPMGILDQRADAKLVNHLLDTLDTFAPKEPAPKNQNKNALESMGLSPPRAFIQWSSPAQATTQDPKSHELTLGDTYGQTQRFALFQKSKPLLASGALLEMLAHIQNWESFRQRTLLLGKLDDWDVVEYQAEFKNNGSPLKVQRVGVAWETLKQQDVSEVLTPILENLFHQRIKRFIDDPREQAALETRFNPKKIETLTWTGRDGSVQKILMDRSDQSDPRIWAKSLARDHLYFELFPAWLDQIDAYVKALTQATSTGRKSGKK